MHHITIRCKTRLSVVTGRNRPRTTKPFFLARIFSQVSKKEQPSRDGEQNEFPANGFSNRAAVFGILYSEA